MKKEIGSEFWTHCTPTVEGGLGLRPSFYNDFEVRETLCGRTSLSCVVEMLIRNSNVKRVYLPSYCCQTMIEPFLSQGLEVCFYDVVLSSRGLHRVFDYENKCDAVMLMDYFGYIDEETFKIAKNQKLRGKILIYDTTHALYCNNNIKIYDYLCGSYRKWVDINCGFYAVNCLVSKTNEVFKPTLTTADRYIDIRTKMFDTKADYINGNNGDKTQILKWIEESEQILEKTYRHKSADDRSMKVMQQTDVTYIKQRRRDNANVLIEGVKSLCDDRVRLLYSEAGTGEVPLFVPISVDVQWRDTLRNELIKNNIFCPIHWPLSTSHTISDTAKQLFRTELSLVCDQRYDVDDMKKIIHVLRNYLLNN